MKKKLWRCHVCNDVHLGVRGPEVCPTCGARNAFVKCTREEALKVIGDADSSISTPDEVIEVWTSFTDGKEFRLCEDAKMVETLAKGVLENERNHGMKYCPCRITTGDFEKDLKLICPCNFPAQKTYRQDGECWCGLFVKR